MNKAIIITTINNPTKEVKIIADRTIGSKTPFCIIGDRKTPSDFSVEYGDNINIKRQERLFPKFSKILPYDHYSRKNIGYLLAHIEGCDIIPETDDDNIPLDCSWDSISGLISTL